MSFPKKVPLLITIVVAISIVSIPFEVTGLTTNEIDIGLNTNSNNITNGTAESKKGSKVIAEDDKGGNKSSQDNGHGKRFPKLGFNLPFPTIPGLYPDDGSSTTSATGFPNNPGPTSSTKFGAEGLGITSTAVLVKSGILGGLTAIKAAILPPLFIGSIIVFLIAGAVFFTCNVINCGFGSSGSGGGGFGSGFGGLPSFPDIFNRNGYDYYEQQVQPVYQSLDEGYKKYR